MNYNCQYFEPMHKEKIEKLDQEHKNRMGNIDKEHNKNKKITIIFFIISPTSFYFLQNHKSNKFDFYKYK
jgi:hypothetical protein